MEARTLLPTQLTEAWRRPRRQSEVRRDSSKGHTPPSASAASRQAARHTAGTAEQKVAQRSDPVSVRRSCGNPPHVVFMCQSWYARSASGSGAWIEPWRVLEGHRPITLDMNHMNGKPPATCDVFCWNATILPTQSSRGRLVQISEARGCTRSIFARSSMKNGVSVRLS